MERHANCILFYPRYLYDGLSTAQDYHGWYLRRKALDPMFHREKLRRAMDTFNTTADQFVNKLQGYTESGETFRLAPIFHRSTIDIVMRVCSEHCVSVYMDTRVPKSLNVHHE